MFHERHIKDLEARSLDPEMMSMLGVKPSNKLGGNCIAIPYFDGEEIVGTKYRTLGAEKKFMQDVGSRQIFYNINCLRDDTLKDEPIIITEGEFDCFTAMQCGFPRSISVPNGAPAKEIKEDAGGKKYAYVDEARPLFEGCRSIVLATDGDGPGLMLRHDLSVRLKQGRCKYVTYPKDCKDLNDVLMKHGVPTVQEVIRRAKPLKIHGVYKLSDLPELAPNHGLDCCMINLAQHYKLRRGDFTVVTGIPGHGKSSFIDEVACRMAQQHRWKTVFASFETVAQTDHRRALRTFYAEKLERDMTDGEKAAADAWINQFFAFIVPDDDVDVTLTWMLEILADAILSEEAQLVVIDPWNEMDHERVRDQTMTEYVGFAIKQFKKFARKYHVHLIVAAHPAKLQRNRDGKYPIPTLYDISDSANWANKCDVGIVIHRETFNGNEALIRVTKAKFADIGRAGEIKGSWNAERSRYTIEDDEGQMTK